MVETQVKTHAVGQHVVREVVRSYEECWYSYVIIPRALANQWIRKQRAKGYRWGSIDPIGVGREWLSYSYYGGAGRAFANEAHITKRSRRFLVITQRGGLDV